MAPGPAAVHLTASLGVAGTRVLPQLLAQAAARPLALGLVATGRAGRSWADGLWNLFDPFSGRGVAGGRPADAHAVSTAVVHGRSVSGAVSGAEASAGTPNWGTAHQASAHASPAAEPRREDFGISEVNPNGYTGVPDLGDANCKDDCSFRGVCVAGGEDAEGNPQGQCYCQPGYWGESCNYRKASGGSKMRLTLVIGLATVSVVMSFILFTILLHVADGQRRAKEAKMDYAV